MFCGSSCLENQSHCCGDAVIAAVLEKGKVPREVLAFPHLVPPYALIKGQSHLHSVRFSPSLGICIGGVVFHLTKPWLEPSPGGESLCSHLWKPSRAQGGSGSICSREEQSPSRAAPAPQPHKTSIRHL